MESSKNGTFLFKRDYMDYHSDRFEDYSLMIYKKGKLYCLLPSNRKKETVYSHQGLTYGGLIMNEKCTAEGVLEVFDCMTDSMRNEGITKFIYKPVPYIYNALPSQEDLYALFRHNAVLIARNISCTIDRHNLIPFNRLRCRKIKQAERNGIKIEKSEDYREFWEILKTNLKSKYNAIPVHSLQEIVKLAELFKDNIKLWSAYKSNKMVGGILCYYSKKVVHAQYISASHEGKKYGSIDLIISYLLGESENQVYVDLGTSNEDGGRFLNAGLISQKEGFGGRGVCYDCYEIDLTN